MWGTKGEIGMLSVVMISAGETQWDQFTTTAIATLKQHKTEDFELIVMDNGGLGRGDINSDIMLPYAEAVNKAAELATGNWLLILNNDITIRGDWMRFIYDHHYCGPKLLRVEGTEYIEGWFISIQRDLWHMMGGFNEVYKNSWEDVDLAWRLCRVGIYPKRINAPVSHIWGATRNAIPGSNQWDDQNRRYFLGRNKDTRHKWRKV